MAGVSGAKRQKKSNQRAVTKPAPRSKIKTLRRAEILRRLAEQREARKIGRQRKQAEAARDSYKARKKDRGRIVMVGVSGQKDPQNKGRKGYLLYVTKTGKKWLLREKGNKEAYKARKLREIEPPVRKNLHGAVKEFQASRRVLVEQDRAAVKGSGKLRSGGAYDFNEKVVKKLATSLKKTIERQASHRNFLVNANVLVKLPDGSTRAYNVQVPIAKADHISIRLGGLQNFVRKKFYAFMAKELAFDGYVTSGSANHIRRLAVNAGLDMEEWTTKDGAAWFGREDTEIVKIQTIEWKIEQIK